MNTNKNIVYVVMFSTIMTINIFVVMHFFKNCREHFTVDEESDADENNKLKQFIFKIFDETHHRNPTQEEVDKYMVFKEKEKIENEIKGILEPPKRPEIPIPLVIDETNKTTEEQRKPLAEIAVMKTFKTLENLNSNITFSKSFINEKINTIQQQLDDIKLLL